MVLKTYKGGVRSGNTIRCPNTRYKRRYARDAALVKYVIGKGCPDYLEDELTPMLQYSINKKARWALINDLKKEICCGHHRDADTVVSIAERHKLKRKANCVQFHTTVPRKSKRLKYIQKRTTYFMKCNPASSGLAEVAGHTVHDDKKISEDSHELRTLDPEVRYEVFYPAPKTSSIAHNQKYIRDEVLTTFEDAEHYQVTKKKIRKSQRSHKRQHRLDCADARNAYCDVTAWQEEDGMFEPHAVNDSTVVPTHDLSYDFDLEALVEEAAVAKATRLSLQTYSVEAATRLDASTRDSGRAKKYGKGMSVAISQEEVNPLHREPLDPVPATGRRLRRGRQPRPKSRQTPTKSREAPTKPAELRLEEEGEMSWVTVHLRSGELAPELLRRQYGVRYLEASCLPRTFGIDVTADLTTALVEGRGWLKQNLRSLDLQTCVVFRVLDETAHVVSVTPKVRLRSRQLPAWEVAGDVGAGVTLDEVLQSLLATLSSLPEAMFLSPVAGQVLQPAEDGQLQYARSSSLHPSLAFSSIARDGEDAATPPSQSSEAPAAATQPCQLSEAPEFCSICLSSIEGGDWLALRKCGHTFCLECWRQHLNTVVQSGALRLTCPEYGCESVVDKLTSLLLLRPGVQRMTYFRMNQHDVEGSHHFRWCHVAQCGRLLHAPGALEGEAVDVLCDCGVFVCFACLGPAHWPAPCLASQAYHRQLTDRGDDVDPAAAAKAPRKVLVRTKKCPHCRREFEKDGGCPYMACPCGKAFCWGCGKSYLGITHNNCSSDEVYNTKERWIAHIASERVAVKPPKAPSTRHYTSALAHRRVCQKLQTHACRKLMENFAFKLQRCCMRGWWEVGVEETEGLQRMITSARATTQYVSNCRKLLVQAHHVLEYSYVLRDTHEWAKATPLAVSILGRLELTTSLLDDAVLCGGEGPSGSALGPGVSVLGQTDGLVSGARDCLTRLAPLLSRLNRSSTTLEQQEAETPGDLTPGSS